VRTRVLLLALALLGVYARTWNFDFVAYDDPAFVTRNPQVAQGLGAEGLRWSASAVVAANWHPLTLLSHMLDVELFGVAPGPAHWVNAGLHLVNALLVFALLRSASGLAGPSLAVAALFALHPIQVEAVAWISQRKTLLAGCFSLQATLVWLGFARGGRRSCYAGALLLFAAALASKPTAVAWPALWLLLDAWPLARWRAARDLPRLALEKLPFFALAAALGWITLAVQSASGAVAADHGLALAPRALGAALAYAGTLRRLVWPADLAVHYPHPYLPAAGGEAPPLWQPLLASLLLVALTLAALRSLRTPLAVGWLWFAGLLLPTCGLVQVGTQALADRHAYLPSVGVFAALVFPLAAWARTSQLRARWLSRAGLVACALLGALSFHQLRHWYGSEALYRRAIQVSPRDAAMRFNLANAYLAQKRHAAAIGEYRQALAVDASLLEARVNLAIALQGLGQTGPAIRELRRALERHPESPAVHLNLGNALLAIGRVDEAIAHFERTLELEPGARLAARALARARSLPRPGAPP